MLLTMLLKYSKSSFLDELVKQIAQEEGNIIAGKEVTLCLPPGGYGGNHMLQLHRDNFESLKEMHDPSRFPARIKAIASALRVCRWDGTTFHVKYNAKNGKVIIQKEG